MNLQNKPEFTNEPCPECKKDGDKRGYVVKMDCKFCSGTGKKPK